MKQRAILLSVLGLLTTTPVFASEFPLVYECKLQGVSGTRIGHIVVTPKTLAQGGSSLDLSDSTSDVVSEEFASASVFAFAASQGNMYLTGKLTLRRPDFPVNGRIKDRTPLNNGHIELGEQKLHVEHRDREFGVISIDCTKIKL